MLLREICAWKPLPKVKISISDAYFSAAKTMADFFNRIGQERSVTNEAITLESVQRTDAALPTRHDVKSPV
jgi:hypothetical protein